MRLSTLATALLLTAAPVLAQTSTWEAPPEAKNIKRPAPADDKSLERTFITCCDYIIVTSPTP